MSETVLSNKYPSKPGMATKAPLMCQKCTRKHKDERFEHEVVAMGGVSKLNGVEKAKMRCWHCGHEWASSHPDALLMAREVFPDVVPQEELFGVTEKMMGGMTMAGAKSMTNESRGPLAVSESIIKAALKYASVKGYTLTRTSRHVDS